LPRFVAADAPNFETADYAPWIAYGVPKSADARFAAALARRQRHHTRPVSRQHHGHESRGERKVP